MAETTQIEWCDHTWNPWIGCTKVSAACDHCYAERWGARFGVEWGNHERRATSDSYWKQPHRWNRAAQKAGVRKRVFCASLADVFDNQVEPAWRGELWDLIYECNALDWLLLTKRPQNIAKMLPLDTGRYAGEPWPWPHVWLGTTAENQEEWDRRIAQLAAVPAAVHFVSVEPMLGPIDVGNAFDACGSDPHAKEYRPVDWVIVGGESGSGARPMHPDWVRSLRDECQAAGVAFHFKQWGALAPVGYPDGVTDPKEHLWIRVGKKAAGRLLDGRTWDEFPA